jgi:hypothetical protein
VTASARKLRAIMETLFGGECAPSITLARQAQTAVGLLQSGCCVTAGSSRAMGRQQAKSAAHRDAPTVSPGAV